MRYKLITTTCLLFGGIFCGFAQDTLSLDAAIREAMEKNHNIRIAKYTAEIAANNATAGNAGLLPKIDANAGGNMSVNDTRVEYSGNIPPTEQSGAVSKSANASLNLSYTLFDGFGNIYTFQKLKTSDELAELQSRLQIENTLSQVITAYYQFARQAENLKISEELIRISNNRFERAKIRSEFGGTSLEKLNAEVDLNTDSLTYANTNLAYKQTRNQLNLLLNRNLNTDTRVSRETEITKTLQIDVLRNESSRSNASLLSAERSKRISELDLKIAKAARSPRLSLSSAYGFSESRNDASFVLLNRNTGPSAGLTMSFNLFDGNRKNTLVNNAKLGAVINKERYEEALIKAEAETNNMFMVFSNNIYILELAERNLKTAELNFKRTEELYDLGQATGLQFRDAQLNLLRAQNRISEAIYNAKVSEMELMRITGQLIR